MGSISRFNLTGLMEQYGTRTFVETGTGQGVGLAHAATLPFDVLRSCEVEMSLFGAVVKRFEDDQRVHIVPAESTDFIRWVCRLLDREKPILFWLDAHFPGADYGLKPYGHVADMDERLPLRRELGAIFHYRRHCSDVIICDDLRIYLDGPFQHGNLPDNLRSLCPKSRSIDFVHLLADETHNVKEMYDHEGYLLITPKGIEPNV